MNKEHKLPTATKRQDKLYNVTIEATTTLSTYPISVNCSIDESAPNGMYLIMGDPAVQTNSMYAVCPLVIRHPGHFILSINNTSPNKGSLMFKSGQVIANAIKLG